MLTPREGGDSPEDATLTQPMADDIERAGFNVEEIDYY
jgi:hypothetical protein